MLGSFYKTFNNMICDRVEEIDMLVFEDKEHNELDKKIDRLFYEIKEKLSDENKKLISEFTEMNNLQVSIMRSIVYKQGLKDGIELKNILKLVI